MINRGGYNKSKEFIIGEERKGGQLSLESISYLGETAFNEGSDEVHPLLDDLLLLSEEGVHSGCPLMRQKERAYLIISHLIKMGGLKEGALTCERGGSPKREGPHHLPRLRFHYEGRQGRGLLREGGRGEGAAGGGGGGV